MNQARVDWELACKAFSLMNVMEQATVLTIYRHTSGPIVESWINSVYKVCDACNRVQLGTDKETN